jgi:hypothetical protein
MMPAGLLRIILLFSVVIGIILVQQEVSVFGSDEFARSRILMPSRSRVPAKHISAWLESNVRPPQELKIAFVGDSLMRNQYLSLAYFLHYGNWYDGHHAHFMAGPIYRAQNELL